LIISFLGFITLESTNNIKLFLSLNFVTERCLFPVLLHRT